MLFVHGLNVFIVVGDEVFIIRVPVTQDTWFLDLRIDWIHERRGSSAHGGWLAVLVRGGRSLLRCLQSSSNRDTGSRTGRCGCAHWLEALSKHITWRHHVGVVVVDTGFRRRHQGATGLAVVAAEGRLGSLGLMFDT